MKKNFLLVIIVCCLSTGALWAKAVTIVHEKGVPQASYAARKLSEALAEQGYKGTSKRTGYDYLISLAVHPGRLGAEAFSIIPEGKVITIYGGDYRGMIYGALALAEMLRNGTGLEEVKAVEEKPNLKFRGIKYNLPWDTHRPSSALDQHYKTAR